MKKLNGFTLIELLVTVTIIGILSSIAVYGLTSVRQKAQDTSHLSSIRDLQLSLEAYKSVNNTYPDAGTQGSANYILNLAPGFIGKLPVDPIHQPLMASSTMCPLTRKHIVCMCVALYSSLSHNQTSTPRVVTKPG